eukprot:scaffold87_cov388-Prasinococcus_capsulatus_cf.AAC.6
MRRSLSAIVILGGTKYTYTMASMDDGHGRQVVPSEYLLATPTGRSAQHFSSASSPWSGDARPCRDADDRRVIDRYSEADSIEFVLTNGDGDWDKAHHGILPSLSCTFARAHERDNTCWLTLCVHIHAPGGNLQASLEHKVVCVIGGKVEPVTQAPPIMLISDLDGTMIGDDEATARFSAFWEARHEAAVSVFSGSVPCLQSLRELCAQGSMLVYSTGRSLASVEELLKDKEVRWIKPTDDMFDGVVTQDRNCVGL